MLFRGLAFLLITYYSPALVERQQTYLLLSSKRCYPAFPSHDNFHVFIGRWIEIVTIYPYIEGKRRCVVGQVAVRVAAAYKSFTESYLNTLGPFADVIVLILSTICAQDLIKISENTKAALARRRRLVPTSLQPVAPTPNKKPPPYRQAGEGGAFKLSYPLRVASAAPECAG
jgi:hypothetical protein